MFGVRGGGISDRLSYHHDYRLLRLHIASRLSTPDLRLVGYTQRCCHPYTGQGKPSSPRGVNELQTLGVLPVPFYPFSLLPLPFPFNSAMGSPPEM